MEIEGACVAAARPGRVVCFWLRRACSKRKFGGHGSQSPRGYDGHRLSEAQQRDSLVDCMSGSRRPSMQVVQKQPFEVSTLRADSTKPGGT